MLTDYSEVYTPTYLDLVEITKSHERSHWIADEVDLSQDVTQWKSGMITTEEKGLIRNILRLFTTSDVAVGQGYYDKLIPVIKNNEARNMLGSFAGREGEHSRAYALLSDTLGFGEEFYYEFLEYSEAKEKVEFMCEDIGTTARDFAVYLAKQTLIEGVTLFASFAMLFNFDRLGKCPGMTDVVRWSIQDESIHLQGNTALFRLFLDENPNIVDDKFKKLVYKTARQLVKLEDAFIDKCFEMGGVSNLTADEMKEYVKYVADYRLSQLGFKPNWNVEVNPIPWIDAMISGRTHAGFFERSVIAYEKDNLVGGWVY